MSLAHTVTTSTATSEEALQAALEAHAQVLLDEAARIADDLADEQEADRQEQELRQEADAAESCEQEPLPGLGEEIEAWVRWSTGEHYLPDGEVIDLQKMADAEVERARQAAKEAHAEERRSIADEAAAREANRQRRLAARAKTTATSKQVSYLLDLLRRRGYSTDGPVTYLHLEAGLPHTPEDRALEVPVRDIVEDLSIGRASRLINSLGGL